MRDFIDLTWSKMGGSLKLRLLTEDGVRYEEPPIAPYFYLRESDITNEVLRGIGEVDEKARVIKVEDYHQGDLRRVEMSMPNLVGKVSDVLEELEVETLQSDVPYARRVMIDQDWTVCPPDDMLVYDLEIAADSGVPDTEKAEERILTICAIDESGEEFVFAYDNEQRTIREFLELAKDRKCVIGWNSITFDWPYLRNRAERLDISFDDFRVVNLDALPVYKKALLISQNNYKLEHVVDEEFDEDFYQFEDVDYSELTTYFEEDRDRLIEYNLEDVRVLKKLQDKYHFKKIVFDLLASNGYCRPERVFYTRDEGGYEKVEKASNSLVEGVILNESTVQSDDYPVIWPNKGSQSGKTFRGAKVLDPVAGLHHNVVLLDFSSMYPSIIEALNVGPETWREGDKGEITAPIGSFVKEPESKFARSYRRVQSNRQEWKDKKSEATRGSDEYYVASAFDTGLKAYVNTFYGVLGSSYSRFYKRQVAENITLMGQQMIEKTEELAESRGYEVLYGDTDSVIIKLGESEDDPVVTGKELAASLTRDIKKWMENDFNANSELINLELDEVFESFFLTDKKKRYAGFAIWEGTPCYDMKMTGFEAVRGDAPEATQEFQVELLRRILQGEEKFSVIDDYKDRLFEGELDNKIVKHVGLSKPISEYKSMPPHVRIAKRHEDEFTTGDEIPYVKYGNDPKDVVRADTDDFKDYLSTEAYRYLWDRHFKKIYQRLGLERHDSTTLGDFT